MNNINFDEALKMAQDIATIVERNCTNCRYHELMWDEEPCDSCTLGGDSFRWKPIAQPERMRGRWIKNSDTAFYWKCSECGAYLFWRKEEYLLNGEPNYCPNCGADMRGEE